MLNRFVVMFHPTNNAPHRSGETRESAERRASAVCLTCGHEIIERRDGSVVDGGRHHSGSGRPSPASAITFQHCIEGHAATWCYKSKDHVNDHWKQVARDCFLEGRDDEAISLIFGSTEWRRRPSTIPDSKLRELLEVSLSNGDLKPACAVMQQDTLTCGELGQLVLEIQRARERKRTPP